MNGNRGITVGADGGTLAVAPAQTLAFNVSTAAGQIAGSGSLAINGPGTVSIATSFTGTTNANFTGPLAVNGGALVLYDGTTSGGAGGAFQSPPSLTLTGGIVHLEGTTSGNTTAHTGAGDLILNAGANEIAMDSTGSGTGFDSTFSVTSSWARNVGAGLFVNYAPTTREATYLSVAATVVNTNGILGYAVVTDSSGATGFATIGTSVDNNFSGLNIQRYSSATTLAAGSNSATTNFTNASSLTLTTASSIAANSLAITAPSTVNLGGASDVLTLTTGGLLLTGGASSITNGQIASAGPDLIVQQYGSAPLTISAVITGANALTVTGANAVSATGLNALASTTTGETVLSGANNYTGGTYLNTGTLALNNAAALGAGALVINGGALDNTSGSPITLSTYNNAQTWNSDFTFVGSNNLNLGTGAVSLGAVYNSAVLGTRTITVNANTLTVGGVISNSSMVGGLAKAGPGVLDLTAANLYTGPTTVNAGTLLLDFSAGGTASNILASSETLALGGGTLSLTGLGSATNSQTVANTVLNSGASTVALNQNGATSLTLAMGAISRGAGGTLNFSTAPSTTGIVATTAPTATTPSSILYTRRTAWATTGSGPSLDYATVNGSSQIVAYSGAFAAGANLANMVSANANYTSSAANTLSGSELALTGNTLQYTGAASTTEIGATASNSNTITLNGLMQAGTGALTIQDTGASASGGLKIGANQELVITGNTQNITIAAKILDSSPAGGALTYSGGGTLTLGSAANAYTGITTINSGTVAVSADASLGTAPGTFTANQLTLAGGTLQVATSFAMNANRGITVAPAGGTIGVAAGQTLTLNASTPAGVIAGSGPLTINGSGTVQINDTYAIANTFTTTNANFSGPLAINGGTLVLNDAVPTDQEYQAVFPALPSLTLTSGTLHLTGTASHNTTFSATMGNLILNAGADGIALDYVGDNASGYYSEMALSNNWTRNVGASLYVNITGDTAFGKIQPYLATNAPVATTNGILGYAVMTDTGGTGFATSSFLGFTGHFTGYPIQRYTGATTLAAGSNSATTNFTTATSVTNTVGGAWAANSLAITAASTVNLGGNTLTLTSGGLLSTAAASAITNGQITSAGPDLIVQQYGSGALTIGAGITGGIALTATGNGSTTVLSGVNTYTGATYINAGTLQIGGSGSLGSGNYAGAIANSGTLEYSSSAAQTLSGAITGAGALVKDTSASTLTLSATNTYTGLTTVNGGTLQLNATTATSNVLPSSNAVTLGGGTLALQGSLTSPGTVTQTVGVLTLAANTSSGVTLAEAGSATVASLTATSFAQSAGSTLYLNLASAGAGALTLGSTPAATVAPWAVVTDATGSGFGSINASHQLIRDVNTTVLTSTSNASVTDFSTNPLTDMWPASEIQRGGVLTLASGRSCHRLVVHYRGRDRRTGPQRPDAELRQQRSGHGRRQQLYDPGHRRRPTRRQRGRADHYPGRQRHAHDQHPDQRRRRRLDKDGQRRRGPRHGRPNLHRPDDRLRRDAATGRRRQPQQRQRPDHRRLGHVRSGRQCADPRHGHQQRHDHQQQRHADADHRRRLHRRRQLDRHDERHVDPSFVGHQHHRQLDQQRQSHPQRDRRRHDHARRLRQCTGTITNSGAGSAGQPLAGDRRQRHWGDSEQRHFELDALQRQHLRQRPEHYQRHGHRQHQQRRNRHRRRRPFHECDHFG